MADGVKVGTGYIQIMPEMKDFTSAVKSEAGGVSAEGESAGSSFGGGFKKGLTVAAAAVTAAAGAVSAFGASSVQTGMEFDSSMSQVAATMGTTTDQIGELRDFAQEMGRTTAFSATEAADALNYMALAGYDAETSMNMLPTVLNLAAAGGIDLASASDMVTDAQSALGLSLDETSDLVDKMAKASSKSNTSVAQLGDAILKIGGTANIMAGGTTELATSLGILADNGIKGAEGGTHLRNILLSLAAPTDTAAGLLEDLGVQAVDADGNLKPLQNIMFELNESLEGLGDAEKAAIISKIFNKTDIASVNALLGTDVERWRELSGAIDDAAGSAQAMADTQLDNLAGDVTLFKSALEGAKITISDVLTPSLRDFVQFGTNAVSDLTAAFQEDGLSGAMSVLGDYISEGLTMIVEKLPSFFDAGLQLINSLIQGISENLPLIVETLGNGLIDAMGSITDNIPGIADSLSVALSGVLTWISENAGDLIDGAADLLSTLLTNGISILSENKEELVEALMAVIKAVVQAAIEHPELVAAIVGMKALGTIGGKIISGIGSGIKKAQDKLVGFISKAVNTASSEVNIGTAGDAVGQKVGTNIGNKILSGLGTVLQTAAQSAVLVGGFVAFDHVVSSLVLNNIRGTDMWQQTRQEVDAIGTSAMSLSEKYDYLNEKIGGNIGVLEEYVPQNNAVLDVLASFGSELDQSTNGWLGVAEAMGYQGLAAQGVAKNLQLMYGDLWNTIQAEQEAAANTDALGGSMDGASESVSNAAIQMSTELGNLMLSWSQTFGTDMPNELAVAIQAALDAGRDIPTGLSEGIESGTIDVETAIEMLNESAKPTIVPNEINEVGAAVPKEFSDGITDNTGLVEDAAQNIHDTVTNTIEPLENEMSGYGDTSAGNFDSSVNNWSGTVQQTAYQLYEFFENQLGSGLTSNMMTWGFSAGQEFDHGVNLQADTISTTATNIATSVENAFSPLAGWLESAGYDGGAGLYNGFVSWEGPLIAEANYLAWQISSTIRAAFNSHSPSRVMMAIGEDVGEGLAIGIEDGGELAIDAAQDVSYDIIDAASHYDFGQIDSVQNNDNYMEQIITLLDGLQNLKVVMDSGEVVGVLAPGMSNEFERIKTMQRRG